MAGCFAFFSLLPLLVFASPSVGEDRYVSALVSRAAGEGIARERTWEILLHYRPSFFGAGSLIDDSAFFLSPAGKTDPGAELDATLKGLFAPPELGDAHPLCRFPARALWLQERLGIDRERLPEVPCAELQEVLDKVQPRSAVLIFPGSHVNSPASMFGHTLLNIEGPYQSKLLAYAVNYAAATDETNGFTYAYKGITGGYKGYYSILPYYQKVREYNDLERRDIWEYRLDLTPDEVRRLFLHVWELREISSDYFFFGENCSFNLLFLLEAARPSLKLVDKNRPWVIPIDTVRILDEAGIIGETTYRPSKATRIQRLVDGMDEKEKNAAAELLSGKAPPSTLAALGISAEGRQRILDLAIETVEFRYLRRELPLEEYKRRYLAVLTERSRLRAPAPEATEAEPERPERGHGSNRLSLSGGIRDDDPFVEVRLRPAYHHLLDADEGYLPGSQIIFADTALRWHPEKEKVELHAFDLIDIVSLSPRHRFFSPVSWKVSTGFFQKTFDDGDDHLVYRLNPGGGFTVGKPAAMAYVMAETDLLVGGRFRDDFAAGAGASAGLLATIGHRGKLHLSGRKIYFPYGDPHQSLELNLDTALKTGPNSALTLGASRQESFDAWWSELRLGWNYYW